MTQITVGIRELKAQLSSYMHRVKEGATLIITERGKPIGRVVPIKPSVEAQIEELAQAGLVAWSGRKLASLSPPAQSQQPLTVAELLSEDRN